MKVNLKRDFATNDRRYRKVDNPCEMPDEMVDKLPSDAEIVEPPKPKNGKGKKGKPAKQAESAATKGAPPDGAND